MSILNETADHHIEIPEAAEQRVVIEWAKLNEGRWPELAWIFHIPNVRSNKFQRFDLAKQGVRSGVADLCLPAPRASFHGLYIEMKTRTGRVRPEQKAFLDFANAQGYRATVCRGADEAIAALQGYLTLPKGIGAVVNAASGYGKKR